MQAQSTVTAGLLMTPLFPLNSLLPALLTADFLREDSSSQVAKESRNKEKDERMKETNKPESENLIR